MAINILRYGKIKTNTTYWFHCSVCQALWTATQEDVKNNACRCPTCGAMTINIPESVARSLYWRD